MGRFLGWVVFLGVVTVLVVWWNEPDKPDRPGIIASGAVDTLAARGYNFMKPWIRLGAEWLVANDERCRFLELAEVSERSTPQEPLFFYFCTDKHNKTTKIYLSKREIERHAGKPK